MLVVAEKPRYRKLGHCLESAAATLYGLRVLEIHLCVGMTRMYNPEPANQRL